MTTHAEALGAGRESLVVLNEWDSEELRSLAEPLTRAASGLVDDPEWLAVARDRSCHLPAPLAHGLRRFRSEPGTSGLFRVRGLPIGPSRTTPTEKDSVERRATMSAAVLALCAMALGEMVAYRAEKLGALVQNVVPIPGQENEQSNAGSRPLTMHIENAFHPHRPDLVALLCLRNDHDGIAGLTVSSIRAALGLLTSRHRWILGEPRFHTDRPPSFAGSGNPAAHAVLTGAADDPDIRVDFAATRPADAEAAAALAELEDALLAVREIVVLASGDLAIVDNRVALHGRTAFTPRYDGRDRWLQRAFIHTDHRRSRVTRAGGGHVLT